MLGNAGLLMPMYSLLPVSNRGPRAPRNPMKRAHLLDHLVCSRPGPLQCHGTICDPITASPAPSIPVFLNQVFNLRSGLKHIVTAPRTFQCFLPTNFKITERTFRWLRNRNPVWRSRDNFPIIFDHLRRYPIVLFLPSYLEEVSYRRHFLISWPPGATKMPRQCKSPDILSDTVEWVRSVITAEKMTKSNTICPGYSLCRYVWAFFRSVSDISTMTSRIGKIYSAGITEPGSGFSSPPIFFKIKILKILDGMGLRCR